MASCIKSDTYHFVSHLYFLLYILFFFAVMCYASSSINLRLFHMTVFKCYWSQVIFVLFVIFYKVFLIMFWEFLHGLDIAIVFPRYVKELMPNHRQDQESRAWPRCVFWLVL